MKSLASLSAIVLISAIPMVAKVWAETPNITPVRHSDAALAFSSGSIQKTTPIDGIVNLITGDNQSTGNRMLLSKRDIFYLKLANPSDGAVGDLYTVYRRVRKVFHPVTKEYLGFVVNRSAVVRVTAVGHALTTVEVVLTYGAIYPGDPVVRFVAPTPDGTIHSVSEVGNLEGMIVELQADRAMTLVSQSNVVYLDRGKDDGLQPGDVMELYRYSAGLPPRAIGQLRVLSTEPHTATAKVIKANTRVIRGDRFKVTAHSAPLTQPLVSVSEPASIHTSAASPSGPISSMLTARDSAGQSRLNLGEIPNFLHYDSGEAAVKPESYKVLDQLIEHLRATGDTRLVRIEGHTDNVEIGPSLKSRYASNVDLSKARANGILRYLVEKGGFDATRFTVVGYGDTKPAVPNVGEEGRTKNRRVEILLYHQKSETPSKSDILDQPQKVEHTPTSMTTRATSDQSSVTASNGSDSANPPISSMGNASPSANKDGAGVPSFSDAGGFTQSAPGKQDSPTQQRPTAGAPGE